MIELGGACRRHREVLVDALIGPRNRVEFGRAGPDRADVADALAHVDRCARCRSQLEATSLVVVALHRLGDEVARVEPPAAAWPRLEAQVTSPRAARPMFMSPVAGMALSLAILVALNLGVGVIRPEAAQPAAIAPGGRSLDAAEVTWLREHMQPRSGPAAGQVELAITADHLSPESDWPGPDGLAILANADVPRQNPVDGSQPPVTDLGRRS